jgi:hypothetical protein
LRDGASPRRLVEVLHGPVDDPGAHCGGVHGTVRVGEYHNDGHSHIDALSHVSYRGSLYNGAPADSVTDRGASLEGIDAVKDGLVARGVLLDIPR